MIKQVGNKTTLIKTTLYRLKKPSTAWLFCSLTIACCLLVCLLPIFGYSFNADSAWEHLKTYLLLNYTFNTILLVFGVSLGSLILGIGNAYFVSRYEFKGRHVLEKLLILPLAVPSYLLAYALSGFFDFTGPFKQTIHWLFGEEFAQHAYFNLQHLPGLILIISVALYPYIYLAGKTTFNQLAKQYHAVGLSLQLSKSKVWQTIILPMSLPTILSSVLLVVMECLNDYGASKYFGVNTLTTGVFRAWFSMNSLSSASRIAAVLLGLVTLLVWLKNIIQARKKYTVSSINNTYEREQPSTVSKIGIYLVSFFPLSIGLFIPLIFMVYAWWQSNMNFEYINLFQLLRNSFGLAGGVAFSTLLIAVLWQFTGHFFRVKKLFTLLTRLATLGYTIPGAVIGIGVIGVAAFINQSFSWFIGGSFLLLFYGLIFRVMAVAYQNISSGFLQLPPSTVDTGQSLGIKPLKMLGKIYLPLNIRFLTIGFILVFIDVLKELPLTLILRPFNFDTLATKTYEYANDEMLLASFHVAPFIILVSMIPIWILQKINR